MSSTGADQPADSGAMFAALTDGEAAIGRGMPSEAETAPEAIACANDADEADQLALPAATEPATSPEQPIATEQPIAPELVTVASELEPAAVEGEDQVADEVTANALSKADFAATEDKSEAPATDIETGDVAALEAPQHAAIEPTEALAQVEAPGQASAEVVKSPAATDASEQAGDYRAAAEAAAAGNALTDGAQVISIDARARKQKSSLAIGSAASTTTRSRPGRRLATKVAACIIALLGAATLLAVVDRAALGSVPQPPWLPSYAPAVVNWSLFNLKQATGQSDPVDAGVTRPRPFAHEDPLLRRYLEIWPAGS